MDAETFVNYAMGQVNTNPDWVYNLTGLSKGSAWSCAFVVACAKQVGGMIGISLYDSTCIQTMLSMSVKLRYGTYIIGPYYGGTASPKTGDIIVFKTNSSNTNDQFSGNHIGIVYSCYNNIIRAVEGDCGTGDKTTKVVELKQYYTTNNTISLYYTPNWS
ncbi:MAG: hypothetical protein LUC17_01285 [Oscillospiraceae bacterium]|nr:hypothetical protein [Oscillospiraceae bacterium]